MHKKYFLFPLFVWGLSFFLSGCMDSNLPPGASNHRTSSPTGPPSSEYQYYFGQFHSHTSFSDGMGTPAESYVYARDVGGADFFAITDHSHYFDSDLHWAQSDEWTA
ncbi:MAG TPA: hypothetical protein VHY08_20285, partial [Bacillota bacterium]|nr:hypothetical protein [Bacillota bacterium]